MGIVRSVPDVQQRWLQGACTSGALLGGVMASWLVIGPLMHELAIEGQEVVQHKPLPQASQEGARMSEQPAPMQSSEPPAPNASLPAPVGGELSLGASRVAREPNLGAPPPIAAKPAHRTVPRVRPLRPGEVAPSARPLAAPAEAPGSAARAIDLNAKADLDLMNVPSSPLEAQALEQSRARRTASLDRLTLIPDTPYSSNAPESGALNVNSQPWALVFIDDRIVGTTPLRAWKLSAGEHSLRLLNRRYALDRTAKVVIRPGETLTYVEGQRE